MNLKQIGMIALVMALICVMPALAAVNAAPVPAPSAKPVATGTLQISIARLNGYDQNSWDRYVSIAPYGPEPVVHPVIGLNGIGDIRLPAGQYYVVLPYGHGSGFEMDTWKPEAFDLTIKDGQTSYAPFIGAGL